VPLEAVWEASTVLVGLRREQLATLFASQVIVEEAPGAMVEGVAEADLIWPAMGAVVLPPPPPPEPLAARTPVGVTLTKSASATAPTTMYFVIVIFFLIILELLIKKTALMACISALYHCSRMNLIFITEVLQCTNT
jgi:hypothetical protein